MFIIIETLKKNLTVAKFQSSGKSKYITNLELNNLNKSINSSRVEEKESKVSDFTKKESQKSLPSVNNNTNTIIQEEVKEIHKPQPEVPKRQTHNYNKLLPKYYIQYSE
jgi:hypothetical protein